MKKSVVITGGNRGIGAATAMLAARNGWDVCISYNRHGAQADDIVCRIGEAGGKAIAVQADMACEDAIVAMFARCDAELSPLGGLVNNAGFLGGAGAFLLLLHELFKTRHVHREATLGAEEFREIDGKAEGVVELKCVIAGECLGGAYAPSRVVGDALVSGMLRIT